jgi:hypothetical protein
MKKVKPNQTIPIGQKKKIIKKYKKNMKKKVWLQSDTSNPNWTKNNYKKYKIWKKKSDPNQTRPTPIGQKIKIKKNSFIWKLKF